MYKLYGEMQGILGYVSSGILHWIGKLNFDLSHPDKYDKKLTLSAW